MTLGIELLLAADIRVAAAAPGLRNWKCSAASIRSAARPSGCRDGGGQARCGWLLTGDEFDAAEAHRIGLVQEVAPDATAALARAREIAHTIADRAAPLGVQATLRSAHLALHQGEAAAIERLRPEMTALFGTADAAEGVQSFVERRQARFEGR
ncbi:hypothetical protein H7I76_26170 [Mycolicibacterium vaccae]|nr:hypothetical protein [Mycolicibacterium vaccae]